MRQAISTVFVAPPAKQQFCAFAQPLRTLLVKRLYVLRTSPRPPGVTKLEGLDHLYRIREGGYRIVYMAETGLNPRILVLSIRVKKLPEWCRLR
jgi:mRNA-degrading endonuclease RelE of RelBE toxin-antitoxin system